MNKSHPDDKVVEQPRIIRPPRPNLKNPKPHQNYHSADFTSSRRKNFENSESSENNKINEKFGGINRSLGPEYLDEEEMRNNSIGSPPRRLKSDSSHKKINGKLSVSFKENASHKKSNSFRSDNSNFSQIAEFKNSPLFQKMTAKIRNQAQRILDIEGKLIESEKRETLREKGMVSQDQNNFTASVKSFRITNREEMNLLKKKNELLSEENSVLKQKIEILEKSVEKAKSTMLENLQGGENKERIFGKISELETENIELREVLKQECIKNEKLNSMVELLRKISEEKLQTAGFNPIGDSNRVDTLIDAMQVYENNEDLIEEIQKNNQEKEIWGEKIEKLESVVESLNIKNQYLIEFKTKGDEEILRLKKREVEFEKLVKLFHNFFFDKVELMKDKIQELQIFVKSEKNKNGNLDEKMKNYKEIVNNFIDKTNEISEVMNFSTNDLLM